MELLNGIEVEKKTKMSRSCIYKLIKENDFPAPINLNGRNVAWIEEEIDAWIAKRVRKRNEEMERAKREREGTLPVDDSVGGDTGKVDDTCGKDGD